MAKMPAVLLVDENEDNRVEVRKLLTRAGLEVAGESRYGVSASSAAHDTQPDVVLVGIEEPPNRSLESISALAHLLLDTPVVAYSSINDPEVMRRAVRAGVRDYLVRPFTAESLTESIFRALEEQEKRQIRRAGQAGAAVRGSVVTVTGAKGGVGKSSIAISLSLALRAVTGRTVVLIDADTHFGDIATMLNLRAERTVTQALAKVADLDRASIVEQTIEHPTGIHVLPSPRDPDDWNQITPDDMDRLIDLLAQAFDFVVIDTPDVFDPVVQRCILDSTLSLIVTSADMSSITDTRTAIRLLERWDCPPDKIRPVVNFIRSPDGVREQDVQDALSLPIFWSVPFEKAVPDAAQLGESVVVTMPKTQFSQTLREMAGAISGSQRPRGAATGRIPVLRRLVERFPVRAG